MMVTVSLIYLGNKNNKLCHDILENLVGIQGDFILGSVEPESGTVVIFVISYADVVTSFFTLLLVFIEVVEDHKSVFHLHFLIESQIFIFILFTFYSHVTDRLSG